jgi:hypothetical protein
MPDEHKATPEAGEGYAAIAAERDALREAVEAIADGEGDAQVIARQTLELIRG